jgi:hypothetical protein
MERPDWSHFDVMAMKRIAFIQSSNVDKFVDAEELRIQLCNYVDVYYNDRITDELAFSAGSATPREIEKFKLRPCDVIITKDSETPGDIAIPAFVDESAAGVVCGYHLAILRAHAAVMRKNLTRNAEELNRRDSIIPISRGAVICSVCALGLILPPSGRRGELFSRLQCGVPGAAEARHERRSDRQGPRRAKGGRRVDGALSGP